MKPSHYDLSSHAVALVVFPMGAVVFFYANITKIPYWDT